MIIIINGPYGSGKTTVAKALVNKIDDSLVFDAEEVGYMMSAILKDSEFSKEFHDVPFLEKHAWRQLVPMIAQSLQQNYKPNIIIPVTMYDEAYFTEMLEALRIVDNTIYHFCLLAPLETIYERLQNRGEQQDGNWPFQQAKISLGAFESPMFDVKIDTYEKRPDRIVEEILDQINT